MKNTKSKTIKSPRRSQLLSWLRSDRPAPNRREASRRLLFDRLEDRKLLTATLDTLIDQGPIKLEDDDWESQVVDQGIAGKLDVGDVLLSVIEIQASSRVLGTTNILSDNSLTEANFATYTNNTNTITGISIVKVATSVPVLGGFGQEYTFVGISGAEWFALAGLTGVSDGTAAILYDDPISAPANHIDFSSIAAGIATATEGTMVAQFEVAGWRARSIDFGGDPTNPIAIDSLEFIAGLNTTSGAFVPLNILGDPDFANTQNTANFFASLGATDLQLQGELGTGSLGGFQLRTDTDLYVSVISPPASLGDVFWHDLNADGKQDNLNQVGGEPGIPGITVTLTDGAGNPVLDASGVAVAAQVTNATGGYLFTNLKPGTYKVTFSNVPAGFVITTQDVSANGFDTIDSDANPANGMTGTYTLASGDSNLTVDAGAYLPASLGDVFWHDFNADGIQDNLNQVGGEPGIPGVTVTLTDSAGNPVLDASGIAVAPQVTGATGGYLFSNLKPGTYKVTFSNVPAGFVFTTQDVSANGFDTIDSDANPANGMTGTYTLASGDNNLTVDAGAYLPASLGDVFWHDLNADGKQDNLNQVGGEPGIPGVTVTLTDGAGNPVLDASGVAVAAQVTGATGGYLFTNLKPGIYKVTFSNVPAGFVFTTQDVSANGFDIIDSDANPANGMTGTYTLASGDNNLTVDAGAYLPASLGDVFWHDLNADGKQDNLNQVGGEPGIPGVTVTLTDGAGNPVLDASGVAVAAQVTNATGGYLFTNLKPGTYKVTFSNVPAGFVITTQDVSANGFDTIDSDANPANGMTGTYTLASGESNLTVDAGAYLPASLGDVFWHDLNADGKQDNLNQVGGEPGIPGVTVTLTDGAGNPVLDASGVAVAPQVTNANGGYLFTNLKPGTYKVTFSNVPAGFVLTTQDVSANGFDTIDSDANPANGMTGTYTLASGDSNLTVDAGAYLPASLGDVFWHDLNADGKQDNLNQVGGEPGIPGVTVTLTDGSGNPVLDASGVAVAPQVTNATGGYLFTNLKPGTYKVTFSNVPAGFVITTQDVSANGFDTIDSDANPANGMTGTYTLASGESNLTVDAGAYLPASLGDVFWHDFNADGKQDNLNQVGGEPGIPGVTVTLTDGAGNPVLDASGVAVAPQVTGANGGYLFTNLKPGTYKVTFSNVPAGFVLTTQDVSANGFDTIDSDANPANGMTGTYTLASGDSNLTVDAGAYLPASLGDVFWHDLNADGIQDNLNQVGGEPGIPGVTVTLTDGAGNPVLDASGVAVAPQVTNANGGYLFTNLKPGTYKVTFSDVPAGFVLTTQDVSANGFDTIDSDANQANGMTGIYILVSGENNLTVDAGAYLPAPPPEPGIDIEKTTSGSSNTNSVAPDYDNEDAANGTGVPLLTPGSDVTWTYKVTNTGNTTFTQSEIAIVDDNGTPGNTSDDLTTANGKVTFLSVSSGDADNLLEPGEVWLYKATGVVQTLQGPIGTAVTMDFSGSSPLDGTDGNVRQFSSGGVSVKATAFSREKGAGGQWAPAYLGSYGGGLGVTDSIEGDGSGDMHTVDNVGRDNYVLFAFDQNVIVDSTYLGYVVNDSDLQVWIGTLSGAYSSLPTLSDSVLASLGFTEVNLGNDGSPRTADINNGNYAGNVLIIAADTTDATPEDRFKIEKVKVNKTSPGIYENKGVVIVPGGLTDSDLSHYKNPTAPPPQPGIDIEKTTNGSSNTNSVAPDYDNEDAANGTGVPLLTPGSDVTWTYKVTNTGNTTFTQSEIAIVDDNGTPGSTADDLTIANGRVSFLNVSSGDADNLLEPGEMWLYKATGVVQTLQGPVGTAVTMDFSGSSPLDGTDGNVRQFSSGGVSVKATAFSREKGAGGQWAPAYLGSYGGGLGVTDSIEGDGSGDMHTVDNVGRDNYVLFAFDQNVIVDSTYLGYVVNDSDLQVWIGTLSGAYSSLPTLSDSVLASLGFTEVNLGNDGSPRTADINNGNYAGNVLIIAADTTDATPEDRFKIEKVKVNKTSPGIYENKGVVIVPGGLTDSDLSHYKNPTAPPPQPGIDIEKTTNGSSNTNSVAPNYDNEDAANGTGVPLLTPGSDVTWTYKVTNTGNTTFTQSEIAIVDDNGTPGNTADDLTIANGKVSFLSVSSGDADNLLEPGEVWLYKATGVVQTLQGPIGTAVTMDFSGSSSLNGTDGNVRQFSSGGVSVKATAFSREKGAGGQWAPAYLGSYGGGLGVTDSIEGDGSGDMHTVDNVGRDNYVLFAFDQNVIVDSTYLGYVVNDSDLQVWIGTLSGAYSSLPTLSDSVLANLGFTEVNLGSNGSPRTADINNGNYAGNVLIIAADTTDATPEDRFKIEKVKVNKTSPGIYENKGVVTVPGGLSDSDLSHYKNNSPAPIPLTTKFYVVDASSDRTFEYGTTGQSLTDNALNLGNTNPRGAASTIEGNKVWVVDSNRRVYVYDDSGTSLGNWTPKTSNGNNLSVPEGITTDGTSVWIVDKGTDTVYKYSNAANRTTGSQNASSSSFSLNSYNSNPTDLVTDGNYVWVVDDGSTNKVFKYTINGGLVGSWSIDSENCSPTGITIDPANVGDIWIVDNSTDRVYQYFGATSFTQGWKSADRSFALADDNTNPQGIADPPPASRQVNAAMSTARIIEIVGERNAANNSGNADRLGLADAGSIGSTESYRSRSFSTANVVGVDKSSSLVSGSSTFSKASAKVAMPVNQSATRELSTIIDKLSVDDGEELDLDLAHLEVHVDSVDDYFAEFE